MQLLLDHPTLVGAKRPSSSLEVKEKQPSNASLRLMNPVASGDNVTVTSAHKLREELPPLVPCCEGRELQINEDLVRSGLSAISVKHESVTQCLSASVTCEKLPVTPGLVKHRNSYRCLHRPDLKRVPYLRRMTPDEIEMFFKGYADCPSRTQCSDSQQNTSRAAVPPDETIRNRDLRTKENAMTDDNGAPLHPIPERSGAEDVPVGMRLHGARARLYTSVLAGATAGDQLNSDSVNEVLDPKVPDVPDDEALNEELQIILPPRSDDTAGSSITSSITSRQAESQESNTTQKVTSK